MYWKIASLLIFAIFCGWSYIEIQLKNRRDEKLEEAFWDRENKANSVRRKPIDHLDYIYIPKELPLININDKVEMPYLLETIEKLRNEKILNLTGYSNTDLKLEYGTANISELSLYDQNYTTLVTTLQKLVDIYIPEGLENEAVSIMEFMVSTNCDIGKTYRLLGKYYLKNGMSAKYEELLAAAENIPSLNKKYIIDSLKNLA